MSDLVKKKEEKSSQPENELQDPVDTEDLVQYLKDAEQIPEDD